MCACVCACVRACVCECTCVRARVCVCEYVCECVCEGAHVCRPTCVPVCAVISWITQPCLLRDMHAPDAYIQCYSPLIQLLSTYNNSCPFGCSVMIFTPCRERGWNKPGIGNVPDPFHAVIKWRQDRSGLRQTTLHRDSGAFVSTLSLFLH